MLGRKFQLKQLSLIKRDLLRAFFVFSAFFLLGLNNVTCCRCHVCVL